MDIGMIKPGQAVKTNAELGKTRGFNVKPERIAARRKNANGTVKNFVPGHGGDVWFVEHADGSIAAYMFDEFESA